MKKNVLPLLLLLLPILLISQNSWTPLYLPSPINAEFLGEMDGKLLVNNLGLYVSANHQDFTKGKADNFCEGVVKYHQKYIGLFSNGIYQSADMYTWTLISPSMFYGRVLKNFNDTLYFGNDKNVMRSTDGGTTWTNFASPGTYINKIIEHKNKIYFSTYNELYSATKAGSISVIGLQNVADMEAEDNVLVVSAKNKLFSSTDGGQSWTTHTLPNHTGINKIVKDENDFYFVNYNAIYKSGFQVINPYLWRNLNFDCFDFGVANGRYYAAKQMELLISEDEAVTWKPLYKGLLNSQYFNQVIPHNNFLFFKGWNHIYRSNSGINYAEIPVADFDFYDDIYSVYNLLIVINSNGWRVSKNNGDTWDSLPLPAPDVSKFFAFRGKLFAKNASKVFYSDTAIFNWTELPVPQGHYQYNAACSDTTLYLLADSQQGTSLVYTRDFGNTWQSNPAPNIGWLYCLKNKVFLIGYQQSAVYSENDGASWSSEFPGIPGNPAIWNSVIPDHQFFSVIRHNGNLYCTTFFLNAQSNLTSGVYRLADGDSIWREFNPGIEDYLDYSGYYGQPQRLFSFKNNLYLTIGNRGIWVYPGEAVVDAIPEIKELKKNSFSVYPNPAQNYIKVNCIEPYSLKIWDDKGSRVCERKMSGNEDKINLPVMKPGMYIFEISTKEKTESIKVMIRE